MNTLYEIALPVRDNHNTKLDQQHLQFRQWILKTFGGYTQLSITRGAWKDPKSDRLYRDKNIPYRILTDKKGIKAILQMAFTLFADQSAFFVSTIGTAEIALRASKPTSEL